MHGGARQWRDLRNSFVPKEGYREKKFYYEDRQVADAYENVSCRDLGRDSQQDRFRRELEDPENIAVFGMCHGTDNKRFDPDRHPLRKDGGLDRRYKTNRLHEGRRIDGGLDRRYKANR